jgi:diadenosine tetraphosphate (Ap4A) HIT family hydrolase
VVCEDELVYVGHIHARKSARADRGWVVVEPKQHLAGIGDLDDAEASAIGHTCSRMARLLNRAVGAEHVYLFVFGNEVSRLRGQLEASPAVPEHRRRVGGAPRAIEASLGR